MTIRREPSAQPQPTRAPLSATPVAASAPRAPGRVNDAAAIPANGTVPSSGLISPEEQTLLAVRAKAGCELSRNKLIEGSMRLVASIARRFVGRGLPIEDLISEGVIGLIHAIDRFDAGRGVKFATFAGRIVQHSMQRAIGEATGLVRLPPKARRAAAIWSRAAQRHQMLHGVPAEPAALAAELGIPAGQLPGVERARAMAARTRIGEADELARSFAELMYNSSDMFDGPADMPIKEAVAQLQKAVEELDQTQATVLRLHFGLTGARQLPLNLIARELGLPLEKVRHDLDKALKQLRRSIRAEARQNGSHEVRPNGEAA